MSIKTNTLTLDEKIRILDLILRNLRQGAREGNETAKQNYDTLKSIAADLQARAALARNDTLVEIEVALERVKRSRTALGYDEGQIIALADTIVRRWPTICQALEQFSTTEPQ